MFNYSVQPQGGSVPGQVPLITSRRVIFGTDNTATTALGPERAGQRWHITRLVTTAGFPGDYVQLTVYRNFADPTSILDFTYQGTQATSETDITLLENEQLVCVWTGGSLGSQAIISVSGMILT